METTHEPLPLDKWSLVQQNVMDILTSYVWSIFFDEASKNGGAKFGVYVGTNAEPLCV
jgi:hypothetical protein